MWKAAYEELKQNSKLIKLTDYKIIEKPKFKSKGRPKKDEEPSSFEYYLDYSTYIHSFLHKCKQSRQ